MLYMVIRYLNPADNNPKRFTKADKDFAKRVDIKDIKFLVKIRYIHKINVFGYENKEKYSIYISKQCVEKNTLSYY